MQEEILVEAHISDIHFGVFEPSKTISDLKTTVYRSYKFIKLRLNINQW